MADVKEKLTELIAKAKRSMWGKSGLSSELARNMYLAENLIANGVRLEEKQATSDESKRFAKDTNVLTNADLIRAMSDEELAKFVASKIVNLENHKMMEQGHTPTATQLSALGATMYDTLRMWLKQPAEEGTPWKLF